ncbi:MAG: DUF4982 domain-containing protein [Oscillospiraceae bacterium]|nr:DUF4982 domain-containing protein [Oscillospiraceae bacterium]
MKKVQFFGKFLSVALMAAMLVPLFAGLAPALAAGVSETDAPGCVFDALISEGKFCAALKNNTEGDLLGNFVLVAYSADGTLAFAETKDFAAKAGGFASAEFAAATESYPEEKGYTYKAFAWDADCVPLAAADTDFAAIEPPEPALPESRQKHNFNMGWKFAKAEPEGPNDHTYLFAAQNPEAPGFDDSAWSGVNLPHSPNDADAFSKYTRARGSTLPSYSDKILDTDGAVLPDGTHEGQRWMYTGKMWYRKHFSIPAIEAGKKVFIEFEAARQSAEVWLNGEKLEGKSENGFIPFGYDLTPHINFGGDNVIAVLVDNTFPYRTTAFGEWNSSDKDQFVLPWHDSHWHPTYGGLYRNLYLYVTDPLHITLPLYSFLATQGTYVYTENEAPNLSSVGVSAEAEIANEYGEDKTFEYEAVIYDMDGDVVEVKSTSVTLPAGKKTSDAGISADNIAGGRAVLTFTLTNPKLWSPDYPYLYSVVTNIKMGGQVVDSTATPLGVRTWEFSYDYGFQINGHNVKLHGWGQKSTNEWAGLASALPDWLQEFTIKQMKDAGGNYIRWGHVAGSPSQIDVSNQYGMITVQPGVESEGTLGSGYQYYDRSMRVRLEAFQDMLIYYRNNPCILLWEYANQQVPNTSDYITGQTNVNIQTMYDLIMKWDPSGNRERTARESASFMLPYMTVCESTDGNTSGRGSGYPIVESEYDRSEAPRRVWDLYTAGYEDYHSVGLADYKDWTSERLAAYAVQKWQPMMQPWHSGGADWIFSDSTSHGRTVSDMSRTTGKVDGVRLEKESYYASRVMWGGEPSLHIIGHWNYKAGVSKTINVVSTAAKVELYVNDTLVGVNASPSYLYLFAFPNVGWEAGEIKAVGYDKNGVKVCEQSKQTHGPAAALKITAIEGPGGLKAGGDVALFDIEAVDAQGRRCLTLDAKIQFDISQFAEAGTGIWQGGYNSGIEDTIMKTELYIEAGINRVAVRTTEKSGELTLGASVIGIGAAQPGKPLALGGAGITPASATLASVPVSNGGGLSGDMPEIFGYDLSDASYPGYGDFDGTPAPPVNDTLKIKSALIKELAYTGKNGSPNAEFEASVVNPGAQNEYAYNDWNKKGGGDEEARKALTFGKLPMYLINSDYIFAPNDDADGQAEDMVRFSAGRDMNVYVAHDDRLVTKPGWLLSDHLVSERKGFVPTGDKLMIGGYSYSIYRVEMDREESVNISSNKEDPSEPGNMFVIFAKERRILSEFLYDDFEEQKPDEEPEGWILSAPDDRTIAVETMGRGGHADNLAVHLVDKETGAYALASRKFSPLLTGKYSVKWKVYENTTGTRLQYQRMVLHDGPPLSDATVPDYYMIETYIHEGQFMYRSVGGSSSNQTKIGPVLAARAWHEIELIVDADTRRYDVVINGVQYGTDIPFTTSSQGKKINHVIIGTRQSGADNDIYYDDVIITPIDSFSLGPIANQYVEAGADYETEIALVYAPSDIALDVQSSDPATAAARIVGTGSSRKLVVTGTAPGSATLTVTATDDQSRTREQSFEVTVTAAQPGPVSLLDVDFNGLAAGSLGTSLPYPALPEMTKLLNPSNATVNIVERAPGDNCFALYSPSADTKAVFQFNPVASGSLQIEFKWLPDPVANDASISIVGGSGAGGAASDAAFTVIKQRGTTINYRTGGTSNTNHEVVSDWAAGRWVSVKALMDVSAQTYSLWIDGRHIADNIPYRYPIATAGGAIWGIAVGKANNQNATVCIDDIVVTRAP